jgi:DNA-binding NtrC family response regulator
MNYSKNIPIDVCEREPGQQTSMKEISQESVPIVVDDRPRELEVQPQPDASAVPDDGDRFTLRWLRSRAEIQAIQQALGYSGWNRRQAARLLKISYRSLLLKIQQHKITRQPQ